jgi:hypothetical protein
MAHAQKWQFSFDYPASWNLVGSGAGPSDFMMGRAMGFVGSGSASQNCTTWSNTTPAKCTTTWSLTDGSIVMRFAEVMSMPVGLKWSADSPAYTWTATDAIDGRVIPGAENLTVRGLPARFTTSSTNIPPYGGEAIPGATEILWWGIPEPYQYSSGYSITAAIRGPDTAVLEAQAKALVASIQFAYQPPLLPTDPTALAQVRQQAFTTFLADELLMSNDESNHSLDCFPRTIGLSNQASITQTLNTAPMTKPLPVTCTTESVEANAMQGWTIVLKQTWVAGSDYPAGEVDFTSYTTADGQPISGSYGPMSKLKAGQWYPHVGPSKYKG